MRKLPFTFRGGSPGNETRYFRRCTHSDAQEQAELWEEDQSCPDSLIGTDQEDHWNEDYGWLALQVWENKL